AGRRQGRVPGPGVHRPGGRRQPGHHGGCPRRDGIRRRRADGLLAVSYPRAAPVRTHSVPAWWLTTASSRTRGSFSSLTSARAAAAAAPTLSTMRSAAHVASLYEAP